MGLVDHGIHMIDTFPWLMDTEICTVRGRGNISGETPTTETMHMDFANGAVGRLVYNDLTFSTDLPSDGLFSRGAAWSLAGYQPAGRGTNIRGPFKCTERRGRCVFSITPTSCS